MEVDAGDYRPLRNVLPIVDANTNEGVPGRFRTSRTVLVDRFYGLMYNRNVNVVFIRAPPFSGKTGFAQLICEKLMEKEDRDVLYLSCQACPLDMTFETFFADRVGLGFYEFTMQRKGDRVLVLDEAQCTYTWDYLWKSVIKGLLAHTSMEGLRIVLLTSFGSFDPFLYSLREGTPIQLPDENVFSLFQTELKPGLALSYQEFEEMIEGTQFLVVKDLIWNLCSNHLGMAHNLLNYLDKVLKNYQSGIDREIVERCLRSDKFLSYTISLSRGIPTLESFEKVVNNNRMVEHREKMLSIINKVSLGRRLTLRESGAISPASKESINLLVKYGFLFEDEEGYLHFASQIHLKAWLRSARHDPLPDSGFTPEKPFRSFLALAIGRMRASNLAHIRKENDGAVRERQMQMELYTAIVSLLPKDVYVTPEWRTQGDGRGYGYVDLVIQFVDQCYWFLELLVDGVGAGEHLRRFEKNGKYYPSLMNNSKYALIDFRESVKARALKPNFLYVSFSTNYAKGKIEVEGSVDEVLLLE